MRAEVAAVTEDIKYAVDGVSVGALVATLAGWLPSIASLLTIIWVALRIWESETVKKLTGRT
jgi:chromate transport protein ChrA